MKRGLLCLALFLASCGGTQVNIINPPEVIAAATRRAQVIADMDRLETMLKRERDPAKRAVLELALDNNRVELAALNATIANQNRPWWRWY